MQDSLKKVEDSDSSYKSLLIDTIIISLLCTSADISICRYISSRSKKTLKITTIIDLLSKENFWYQQFIQCNTESHCKHITGSVDIWFHVYISALHAVCVCVCMCAFLCVCAFSPCVYVNVCTWEWHQSTNKIQVICVN